MRAEVVVKDERVKSTSPYYNVQPREFEEYTRAHVEVNGSKRLVADALRAVADELDPRLEPEPLPLVSSCCSEAGSR